MYIYISRTNTFTIIKSKIDENKKAKKEMAERNVIRLQEDTAL